MEVNKLLVLVVVLIGTDQTIKALAISNPTSIVFTNPGISFSLLKSVPWRTILPFILFFLIGILLKKRSYGMALVISGGISNLIDRFVRGGVVDFIDLKVLPVFNIADLLISLGSIIMLIEIIKQELRRGIPKTPVITE